MNALTLDARLWETASKNGADRSEVADLIARVAEEAAHHLPSGFTYLNILTSPVAAEWVIPESGVMGITYSDEYISMTFDAALPYGYDATKKALRATVFHEMVHAVTFAHDPWRADAMFGAVSEGLATVFEREYAGSGPPWGQYEPDEVMKQWYEELKKLPASEEKDRAYFFDHPDGRRWIVYKVGTWMIDKLLAVGEDLFDLMQLNHQVVIDKFEALT